MDLNDLKIIWQAHTTETIDSQRINPEKVRQLTKGKANNALAAFGRNILYDIGFLGLFLVVGVVAALVYQHQMITTIVGVTALIFVPFFVIFLRQYFSIKKLELQSNTLYHNLNNIISNLNTYVKNYFLASIILTVTIVPITGFVALYQNKPTDYNPFAVMASNDVQLFIVGFFLAMIVLVIGNYFFTNWYLKKMYGNYIEELKGCLAELDELVVLN